MGLWRIWEHTDERRCLVWHADPAHFLGCFDSPNHCQSHCIMALKRTLMWHLFGPTDSPLWPFCCQWTLTCVFLHSQKKHCVSLSPFTSVPLHENVPPNCGQRKPIYLSDCLIRLCCNWLPSLSLWPWWLHWNWGLLASWCSSPRRMWIIDSVWDQPVNLVHSPTVTVVILCYPVACARVKWKPAFNCAAVIAHFTPRVRSFKRMLQIFKRTCSICLIWCLWPICRVSW